MASVTLQKALRVLRTRGPLQLVKRGAGEFVHYIRVMRVLRRRPRFDSVPQLAAFCRQQAGGIIAPAQVPSEIEALLQRVAALKPRRILEIGTANGGTLFMLTRVAEPDAHLISIDLPGGDFGEGYASWRIPLYRSFPLPGQRLDLIRADSHADATLADLKARLKGEPLDFLFIDGDHSYEGVKRDFEMYAALVRPGGLVALHDVASHNDPQCQVNRFWNELRGRYESEDLTERPDQGWAGIGVVRIPATGGGALLAFSAGADAATPAAPQA